MSPCQHWWGPPSRAQPHNPSLAQTPRSPPGPGPPLPCPQGVTQVRGCHPSQRQQRPRQLHGVLPVLLDVLCCRLTPSHCRGDELPPVPPQQGPPVPEPEPPSPAFLHQICRPGRTPRAKGTAEHSESPAGPKPAGNRPAGPPRHLRGVRAQDSHVRGETEAGEALGRCSRVDWQDPQSLLALWGQPGKSPWTPTRPTKTQLPADAVCPPGPRARAEPVPDWFGCRQPCPAGRAALRSITPERTQTRVQVNGPTQQQGRGSLFSSGPTPR